MVVAVVTGLRALDLGDNKLPRFNNQYSKHFHGDNSRARLSAFPICLFIDGRMRFPVRDFQKIECSTLTDSVTATAVKE
jgi:hypothetical protein